MPGGHTKDLWLPTANAASGGRRRLVDISKLQKECRKIGFEAFARHDAVEKVVEIEFRPLNEKVAQAIKVVSGSSQTNALRIAKQYQAGDNVGEVVVECIVRGIAELKDAL